MAKAFVDDGLRRDGDQELPLGPRARATRDRILVAAAERFSSNGYRNTSVADIAAAAGVGLGTVYQYFRDRADIIQFLARHRVATRLNPTEVGWRAADGVAGLERMLANFITGYAETAPLAAVWEEVVHVEPELADMRRRLGRQFTDAVARELKRAMKAGLVRDDLNAALSARALTAMADRFCFLTYVFDPDEQPTAPDEAAHEIALLWANAIGLQA